MEALRHAGPNLSEDESSSDHEHGTVAACTDDFELSDEVLLNIDIEQAIAQAEHLASSNSSNICDTGKT